MPRLPAETAAERFARHAADCRHLARLNDRLLADVGLNREGQRRRGRQHRAPRVGGGD